MPSCLWPLALQRRLDDAYICMADCKVKAGQLFQAAQRAAGFVPLRSSDSFTSISRKDFHRSCQGTSGPHAKAVCFACCCSSGCLCRKSRLSVSNEDCSIKNRPARPQCERGCGSALIRNAPSEDVSFFLTHQGALLLEDSPRAAPAVVVRKA